MQRVRQHDLPQPLSIHLEPEEGLNSSVTVEFDVEQIPCIGDPAVRCYKSNGCIVFEGYCPIDSQMPFSQYGLRNINTSSNQQRDKSWSQTKVPCNPLVLWDAIPRLLNEIISEAASKVLSMDDKRPSSGAGNPPGNSTSPDGPDQFHLNEMNDERTAFITERDRPTLIYPRLTEPGNSTGSSELSVENDPFTKKQLHTVGNIADPNTIVRAPVIIDNVVANISARPSDAEEDAADLVTLRQWKRREGHRGNLLPNILQQRLGGAVSSKDRVSTVLTTYTKSVPLQRNPEEDRKKKYLDLVSASVSESDTGEIEVDLSDAGGSSEESVIYADAACGTGHIDRDASHCVLCGSPLQHRQHDQRPRHSKGTSTAGQPPRTMIDASTRTSTVEPVPKQKDESVRKKSPASPVRDTPSRAKTDADTSRPSRAKTDAGTSAVEETQKTPKDLIELPKPFGNDQDVAVYRMSRASRDTSKQSSKSIKEDDKTQCTLQHILFPKDTCPYSPSLTSLPLDESDIDYIIQRAQLAKAAFTAGKSLCPKERWELRHHHRHHSKSGRSRSSAREGT